MAFNLNSLISNPINNARIKADTTIGKYVGEVAAINNMPNQAIGAAAQTVGVFTSAKSALENIIPNGARGKGATDSFLSTKSNVGKQVMHFDSVGDADFLAAKSNNVKQVMHFDSVSNEAFITSKTHPGKHHQGFTGLSSLMKDLGLARTNRFRVEFKLPENFELNWLYSDGYTPSELGALRGVELNYFIESVSMPGVSIDTHPTNYGGYHTQFPTGYTFDEITMVLRCTGDMRQRAFIDRWVHSIYNFTKGGMKFFDKYKTDLFIYQQDEAGNDIYGVKLRNAFPKMSSALEMNHADTNNYHRITSQWCYEKAVPIKIN